VAWDIAFVLIGMTDGRRCLCGLNTSLSFGHRAFAIAREHRFQLLEGKAAEALAKISSTEDSPSFHQLALNAYLQVEHRPGIDRMRRLLAGDASRRKVNAQAACLPPVDLARGDIHGMK
jgi:hypothetical protein